MKAQFNLVITETSLDESIQKMLLDRFTPFLEQTAEWKEKAEALVVTDISQTREMKMAREGRLALREIRIKADKLRKELKEDSLLYGRAVQGVYNVIESNISPIEKYLERQEKFKEIREMKIREALRVERETILSDVREYAISSVNLGEITEDDFQKILSGAKLQKEAAEQAAIKEMEDRIAREKAEANEREALRLENERLKSEAIRQEAERKAELDRIKAEQKIANMESDRLLKEAQDRAVAEREERDRLESELRLNKEAEEWAEAERLAAIEAEHGKGDKEKIQDLLSDLRSLSKKYEFSSKKYNSLGVNVTELIRKIIDYILSKN